MQHETPRAVAVVPVLVDYRIECALGVGPPDRHWIIPGHYFIGQWGSAAPGGLPSISRSRGSSRRRGLGGDRGGAPDAGHQERR